MSASAPPRPAPPADWQWQHFIVLTGRRNEDEWINDPGTVGRQCCRGETPLPRLFPHPHPPPSRRTRVPFSAHRIRQAALHVNQVLPGWLEGLLEYLLAGFQRRMRSRSRVPDGAVNPPSALSADPPLRFVLTLPRCPFHFVIFHSFSSHSSCGKDLQAEQVWAWNRPS